MPDTENPPNAPTHVLYLDRPHPKAIWCTDCQCWCVSFVTRIVIPGWRLCSGYRDEHVCSDYYDKTVDWGAIPWESRRIHYVGDDKSLRAIRCRRREDPGGLQVLIDTLDGKESEKTKEEATE